MTALLRTRLLLHFRKTSKKFYICLEENLSWPVLTTRPSKTIDSVV